MKKNSKHIQQFKQCKAGLKLFYENTLLITDYEDLQNHLNQLASFFKRFENDVAPNKNIILFKTYLQEESLKKNDIKEIKRKAKLSKTKKKISFLDYIEDYHILKSKGYSYKKISDYSKKYFKIQVSKETVRKYLNQDESENDK